MEKKCCAPDCEHCPFPDCNVEMTKQEKWAAHQREYRRKHPGVDTPYHRRWIENHYEQYRQQQNKSQRRRYRDSFEVREKISEKNRRYYQAHKEQMKEYQVNYRERRRSRVRIRMQKLSETANEPKRGTAAAAGYDLCADIQAPVEIPPGDTVMLSTGLAMAIPAGYAGFVYARSGLSTKEGLRPANCVGVIDSDYRGAVGVPVHNDSKEVRFIEPGQRIAQIVIQRITAVWFDEVDSLDETDRGTDGFGSTGKTLPPAYHPEDKT